MGGCGSGRWGIGRRRPKVENFLRLDVRVLERLHLFGRYYGPQSCEIELGRYGVAEASCVVTAHDPRDQVVVSYMYSNGDGAPVVPVRQVVLVRRTKCGFKNTRAYFCCPRCGSRCGILYFRGKDLACRECLQLIYSSQSDTFANRVERRRIRLLRIAPEGIRPRGMWHRTWAKLEKQFDALERDSAAVLASYAARLGAIGRRSSRGARRRAKVA